MAQPSDSVIYDQYDSITTDAGSSQDFGPQYAGYDAQAADDFVIPSGQTWQIDSVDVAGVYSGTGMAGSVNVFFYSGSVLPVTPVITQTNIMPSSGLQTGNFSVPLDAPLALGEGTYWVSVQANQDYPTNGQWFWRLRSIDSNSKLVWRNPGNGFGRNCQSWGYYFCSPSPQNRDLVFRLNGSINATPTPTVTGTPPTAAPTRTPVPPQPTATGTVVIPPPMITGNVPLGTDTPTGTPPTSTNTPSATSIPTSTPLPCGLALNVISSPNPGAIGNVLYGVAVASPNDVWAAGFSYSGSWRQTLVEHWNGTIWSIVPSPDQPSSDNYLQSVALAGAGDVWAVGRYDDNGFTSRTLVEHWNGSAWSIVPSPNQGPDGNSLQAVTVAAPNDVWAAGYYFDDGASTDVTLVEHWDGSSWAIVSSPNQPASRNYFWGAAAAGPNDVWAVGEYGDGNVSNQTLVEHWNGSAWSIVPSPDPSGSNDVLWGVATLGSGDVWAVGFDQDNGINQTLVEHWNGSVWSVVPSPNQGTNDNLLYAVAAIDPSDVWAVGRYTGPNSALRTLAEHWDGSTWSIMQSPNPAPDENYLFGAAAVGPDDVWSVGASGGNTLIERYADPCPTSPTPFATSTPTGTPVATTPTNTTTPANTSSSTPIHTPTSIGQPTGTETPSPVRGTGTVTATPTICTLSFSDVPPGSTFYPFVRCLACLGIINGYPGGIFRPNANVTRGQLSKIVSNSAGFNDPQTVQMFQDVPVGSTFFVYIGRLVSRGYINGYPCGGSGEPCSPGNLPYFRPNNNATRGQISKIISNAAGFTDPPSGQQFQDVPVGSTYYTYTCRLTTRSIMQGYPCGGPNEPCVPPSNLPYFRPNANATRGQTSKIDAGAFFPDCNPPAGASR